MLVFLERTFWRVAIPLHLLLVSFVEQIQLKPEHVRNWIERAVVGLRAEAWVLSETYSQV